MIERIVLDGAPDAGGLASRLRELGRPPALAESGDGPGTLWVTGDPERARAAFVRGSRAWTVGATGELQRWDDLPLAIAIADGTLTDVRRLVGETLATQGLALTNLAWTPDGAATGEAGGKPIFLTAGPDGEDPQVHVGEEAEAFARDRGAFVRTLRANDRIAPEGAELGAGQTHALDAADSPRPRLARQRFSIS